MQLSKPAAVLAMVALCGCTTLQRVAHVYADGAPEPNVHRFADGNEAIYYSFAIGDDPAPDTLIFLFGGSGCASWKYVMPDYVAGLSVPARIFALNKRFVGDRSTGLLGCGRDFHLANNPHQWVADYSEFVWTQLAAAPSKPRNVVLVGVSEGALPATRVAARVPQTTHLVIIGDGGYSMRRSLSALVGADAVESGWNEISSDSRSIDKRWLGSPYRYWSDIMDIDPLPCLLSLGIPIVVAIGERDESVPVESARFLGSKFSGAGKTNFVLRIYPRADHRLDANGVEYRAAFFAEVARLLQRTR